VQEYVDQRVAAIRAFGNGALADRMGVHISELTPDRVVGSMPVEGNTQPYGLLHGGASAVLAETLGSLGAFLHAPQGMVSVGIEISATHHRSATSGQVTGVATPVHVGSRLATFDIVISDEAGRRLCTSRLTCLFREVPGLPTPPPVGA
jgi:uncharacterized protein (TIGR00369 family)